MRTVIIGLVSGNLDESQDPAFFDGYDDWIRKPFEIEIILEAISRHLPVQYLYEIEEAEESPDDDLTTMPLELVPTQNFSLELDWPEEESSLKRKPELIQPLNEKVLQVMSRDWIRQVSRAAQAGDSTKLYELIEKIPRYHDALSFGLKALLEQFNFAKIQELTYFVLDNDDH